MFRGGLGSLLQQSHNPLWPTNVPLSQLEATAICGNDISSSCLYVSALAISYAGQYAWLALLLVGAVLFLFRKIYGEVVGALPLNGGAYNVLLNTTSKHNAALAGCLTVLSYMATAVLSANEAMHYLHNLWAGAAHHWGHAGAAGAVFAAHHPRHFRIGEGGGGHFCDAPGLAHGAGGGGGLDICSPTA